MKPICFAALLGFVAVATMAQAGEPNCTRASYVRAQTLLGRMSPSPSCGCGAPSCAAPSCRAPSCAAPTCSAPTCAAPTCAARPSCAMRITCAAPTCAAPTCAAPTCAAPTCAAPTCAAPSCAAPILNLGCNTCGRTRCACPRIIPAIMGKIDCLLQRIYSNPCNPVCGRPCRTRITCSNAWDGYQSNCGCDSGCSAGCGSSDHWSPTMSPTPANVGDPFQDDDLRAPPPVPSDARNNGRKPKTSLARLRVVNQEPTLAKPPTHHHSSAVSIRFFDGEVESAAEAPVEVVPVSMEVTKSKPLPKNPLRD